MDNRKCEGGIELRNKENLLKGMFEAVESTRSMNDSVTNSFEEFRKKHNPKQERLFVINCKAKNLKRELARLEPELIKKYPNLIISERNKKVEGF